MSFVTARGQFLQYDMPEIILLKVTVGANVTRLVTLYKRPKSFHEAPLYVFRTDNQMQHIQPKQPGLSEDQVS